MAIEQLLAENLELRRLLVKLLGCDAATRDGGQRGYLADQHREEIVGVLDHFDGAAPSRRQPGGAPHGAYRPRRR